ncbi:hypothetical protein [Spirosoma areae]
MFWITLPLCLIFRDLPGWRLVVVVVGFVSAVVSGLRTRHLASAIVSGLRTRHHSRHHTTTEPTTI